MKLRTKIIVGFLLIVLIPLLLMTVSLYGVQRFQITKNPQEQISGSYDIDIQGKTEKRPIRLLFRDVFIFTSLILIFTAIMVGLWIYQGMAAPIMKLKKATNNIRDGNLDFVLEAEGNDEFSDLCRDFEDMRIRLKESAEEKIRMDQENRDLICNISHDLKTPITAVKGYVEGIMDGVADTPEKMDRYVRTIYTKTTEMDRLINELTFYSKIDTNRIPYNFSRLNALEYFTDCADELEPELTSNEISLKCRINVTPDILIIADGEQLRRVINNIIGNAIKYMDKNPKLIQIQVSDVGDFIQVDITDNGKGISKDNIQYIFDRFYRTDQARAFRGGSGIGLSIVKKIIEDHGGKVWAVSHEGSDTTISFVLRKYQEISVEENTEKENSKITKSSKKKSKKNTVEKKEYDENN